MQPRVDAGFFLLTLSHLVSNSKILAETRCSPEHMVRRTPAQWSTCWASRGCGASAPGHGQSVRLICMLDACHVPGLWADLTRHVIALKICKSGESCGPDNKAAASLGHTLGPPPPKKGSRQTQTLETHWQQIVLQESGPCRGQSSAVQQPKQARVTQSSLAQGQLHVNLDPITGVHFR